MDCSGNCIIGIATQTMARDRKFGSWRSVSTLQYGYISRKLSTSALIIMTMCYDKSIMCPASRNSHVVSPLQTSNLLL